MKEVILFAKWTLYVEIALILSLLLFAYSTKVYFYYLERSRLGNLDKIRNIIYKTLTTEKMFSKATLSYLRHHIINLLTIFREYDEAENVPHDWVTLRKQLIAETLLPQARKLAKSHLWFSRYVSTMCFHYDVQQQDKESINKLLDDKVLLIALNAAKIAFEHPTEHLINGVIDAFSSGRRLQQSVFAHTVSEHAGRVLPIIEKRMTMEKNPYVKAFCYRLLLEFPADVEIMKSVENDALHDNLELKMSVLNYLAHLNQAETTDIIRTMINDSHWEVRVRAVVLLGKLKDKKSINFLGEKLRDTEWWVRVRAAESLAILGDDGLAILKSQDPTVDKYAYEAAIEVLERHSHQE